jgi:predicted NBD/HSP70 family sugar kinase
MPVDATRPARQAALRDHNLGLVLGEIADRGPASRARIAAATGLTKATVSSLVELLAAGGLVRELGADAAGAVGRPGRPVALAPSGPVGIGLEINVDYLAVCTVDLAGAVLRRELVVLDLRAAGAERAIGRAAPVLRRAVAEASSAGRAVAGVAVAVPGLVQTGTDLVRVAPNLGWRDVPVLDALRAAGVPAEVPLRLGNEADFAALGELWCGGHEELDSFVFVSGEIGVGAAVVVHGRLFRGLNGFSGEIGHLPVGSAFLSTAGAGRELPVCACGGVGCLEQVAGQEALLRAAGLPVEPSTTVGRPEGPVADLVALAASGDARALAAVADAGTALGTGIAAVVNLVDVGTVVLGGVYATLEPWLAGPVGDVVRRRVLGAPWAPVRVTASRLGGEAAVRGAATMVVRDVITDPAAILGRG